MCKIDSSKSMARLLFAALSLAVVHGSSYGKVSNSQPWLPLSDRRHTAVAINEPISGSDSVLMHFKHTAPRHCASLLTIAG